MAVRVSRIQGDVASALGAGAMASAIEARRPVVLFTAAWAPACRAFLDEAPRCAALDDVDLLVLDVDVHDADAAGFEVNGVPALEGLDVRGRPLRRQLVGATSAALGPWLRALPALEPVVSLDDPPRRPVASRRAWLPGAAVVLGTVALLLISVALLA